MECRSNESTGNCFGNVLEILFNLKIKFLNFIIFFQLFSSQSSFFCKIQDVEQSNGNETEKIMGH